MILEILETLDSMAVIVAMGLGMGLTWAIKRKPELVNRSLQVMGETSDLLKEAHNAFKDGKITASELQGILKEAKDIVRIVKRNVK